MNYMIAPGVQRVSASLDRMVHKVCEHYGITELEFYSKSRLRNRVEARAIIMYILREHKKMKLENIARKLDKNHASVIHHCKQVAGWIEFDNEYRKLINKIIY